MQTNESGNLKPETENGDSIQDASEDKSNKAQGGDSTVTGPGIQRDIRRALILTFAVLATAAGAWFGMQKFSIISGTAAHQTQATRLLFSQTLPDANGQPVRLAAWQGKPLVINFWATWCAPCVEEIPEFSRVQTEFAPYGVQIVGIGVDNATNIAEFAKRIPTSYPLLTIGAAGTELVRAFGNTSGALPFTLLLNADGTVQKSRLGRLEEADLRAWLAPLRTGH